MQNTLYNLVAREVTKVPHVHSRSYPLHPPVRGEFEFAEYDAQRVFFNSIGHVLVGFETRRNVGFRWPPVQREALASLEDVKRALEAAPEIGVPTVADRDFLLYVREAGRQEQYGPKNFDLIVVSTHLLFNYAYRGTEGLNGVWTDFHVKGHPIIGAFAKAHRAQYGR